MGDLLGRAWFWRRSFRSTRSRAVQPPIPPAERSCLWSETSYTLNVKCVKALRAELKALSVKTPEGKYLELHLARWDGDKAVVVGGLTALCRDQAYARACSAAAHLMRNEQVGSEAEAIQFLEMAAAGEVPAANISLGDLYLIRFRNGRDGRDLCRAYKLWQAGAALGDPVGRRRLDWVQSELKPNCAES